MAVPIRDFLLDDSGDLAVVNGDFAFAAGSAAVPQGIKCRLRMFKGESALDESVGVDWLGQILSVKNPNPIVVSELLREAIAATPDVTDAQNISFTPPGVDRTATVGYQARTVYSNVPQPDVVSVP